MKETLFYIKDLKTEKYVSFKQVVDENNFASFIPSLVSSKEKATKYKYESGAVGNASLYVDFPYKIVEE
ncbi:gp192 [Bacillus phage G]|uniref:Gp192 n=1 Tax=Bacillus phage G TaxID=2884420 RepID=G3MBQ8_9CAUD|nr:gp192 [Bacillus phage G]AEO93452.1 gp192 [Bacillus phage G]